MKAYKGTYNQRCRDFKYEVGKTYTYNGTVSLCESGFHCCINPLHVLYFYPVNDDFQLMEVEVLGYSYQQQDKLVTNKLKVIKILTPTEVSELLPASYFLPVSKYDKRNNLIYSRNYKGEVQWMEYDDRNNVIFHKAFNGDKRWTEYNKLNKLVHVKTENGAEQWMEYNDQNGIIYSKCSYSPDFFTESWFQYDERQNLVYQKQEGTVGENFEKWMTYNENNRCTHIKNSNGKNTWNTYDNRGNDVYIKVSNKDSVVFERWEEYDENNNSIHLRTSNGHEEWREYDDRNNVIYYESGDDLIEWRQYDNNNVLIYLKTYSARSKSETISHFDKNGNRTYYKTDSHNEKCVYDENNNLISFESPWNNWSITIE